MNGGAKNQKNKDCIYAARQGMMAYNSNTMRNSILIKDVGRCYAWYYCWFFVLKVLVIRYNF